MDPGSILNPLRVGNITVEQQTNKTFSKYYSDDPRFDLGDDMGFQTKSELQVQLGELADDGTYGGLERCERCGVAVGCGRAGAALQAPRGLLLQLFLRRLLHVALRAAVDVVRQRPLIYLAHALRGVVLQEALPADRRKTESQDSDRAGGDVHGGFDAVGQPGHPFEGVLAVQEPPLGPLRAGHVQAFFVQFFLVDRRGRVRGAPIIVDDSLAEVEAPRASRDHHDFAVPGVLLLPAGHVFELYWKPGQPLLAFCSINRRAGPRAEHFAAGFNAGGEPGLDHFEEKPEFRGDPVHFVHRVIEFLFVAV